MRHPVRPRIGRPVAATIWLAALALLGLITFQWSWNTLAKLFNGPLMEIRHALAALLLLAVGSAAFAGNHRRKGLHRHKGLNRHET